VRDLILVMKRFFFDLVGEIRARDFMGHECSSEKEAKSHAAFIAHRIGTQRPSFAKRVPSSLSAMNVAQRYSRHQ
jgi:hypothetical protein